MEYYLYVSRAKVDMLLSQIPEKVRRSMAAELGINVGILNVKVRAEQETAPENLYLRASALIDHIKKTEQVGTIDDPAAWIEDSQMVKVVHPEGNRDVVFFVGVSESGTRFGLGGSAGHLVTRMSAGEPTIGWSFMPDLIIELRIAERVMEEGHLIAAERLISNSEGHGGGRYPWPEVLDLWHQQAEVPPTRVKFLARRLLVDEHRYLGFRAVLATPLFVAMDD
jgi:hypothetical protein